MSCRQNQLSLPEFIVEHKFQSEHDVDYSALKATDPLPVCPACRSAPSFR